MKTFQKDGHEIILGDSLQILADCVPESSVDLIFADPPYNIGKSFNGRMDRWPSDEAYLTWCYQWLDLCIQRLKPHGSLYVMTSTQNMPYFDIYLRDRLVILSRIVWAYDSSGVQARKYFGSLYEPILFCVKDKSNYTFNADDVMIEARTGAKRRLIDYRKPTPNVYNSQKVPGNVWQFPRVRYRMKEYENHPTQKPMALLERIVRASSNLGDVVLDPFSGTFTTSAVAQMLLRNSVGVEIEEEYVKIGLRRLGIVESYNGQSLRREPKTFERGSSESQQILALFR
ncbi:MAG: adenine-specific DNA-methyltransferase [Candidatus Coatesbacteria bacterium]|nr:adenine-specific DNA-methyltransferase [Candidatus Coatesbacteria bacterium]